MEGGAWMGWGEGRARPCACAYVWVSEWVDGGFEGERRCELASGGVGGGAVRVEGEGAHAGWGGVGRAGVGWGKGGAMHASRKIDGARQRVRVMWGWGRVIDARVGAWVNAWVGTRLRISSGS